MANHFSILALRTPWTVWKGKKDRTLKDEFPRSVGTQYATGEDWRNSSGKNEKAEPKQKQHSVVDVNGDGSKVRCSKEQYCIGTWNGISMNQSKLEMVKKEMARMNIDILGISSVQFSSVARSCATLCNPMNRSTPGLPVHHQRPEFTQTHVHRVGDAIQPSHPLSSPSPPAHNLSQHQGLFQWVNFLHEVAKVLEFQL